MIKSLIIAGLITLSSATQALDIGGISLPDKQTGANGDLLLNSAGLRTKLFFKVYAIGFYQNQKTQGAEASLALKGPRRIQIVTLRELTPEQLADAMVDAIKANHTEAEMSKLSTRVAQLRSTMMSIGKVSEKTWISLDYNPATGTKVLLGQDKPEQKGSDIPGEDFLQALLRIWLGTRPVQDDLKEKLAGNK